MTAADTLIHSIGEGINALPEDEFGGVIFEEILVADIPAPGDFLEPEPDVFEGSMVPSEAESMVRERNVLGVYIPMTSPGQVVLNGDRLKQFYWALVHKVRSSISHLTKEDLRRGLELVVNKTYQHELFHFRSDVLRQMFGTRHNTLLEEALAVAWSRLWLARERADGRRRLANMNGLLYSSLMREAFQYRSAGYRDWVLYADEARFKPALLTYMAPGNHARLQANGVELEDLLYGSLDRVHGGYIEYVA